MLSEDNSAVATRREAASADLLQALKDLPKLNCRYAAERKIKAVYHLLGILMNTGWREGCVDTYA